jgi:tetratricopeptide (TPR) repeat protein
MLKPYAEGARHAALFSLLLIGLLITAFAMVGCSSPGQPKVSAAPVTTTAAAPASAPAPAPIPDAVRDAYARALAAMRKADWPTAETSLQALTNSNPDLPGPTVNLGIVYVHLNRTADARKLFESAVARWPDFAPGQHQLGVLLRNQGEFAAADAAYARALAADPNYALVYYDRAVLNEIYLQRPEVALQNYEKFQQLQSIADGQVARWIEDLRRRTGATQPAGKPAAKGGSPS